MEQEAGTWRWVFGSEEERNGAIARGKKLRDKGRAIKIANFFFFILTALLRHN